MSRLDTNDESTAPHGADPHPDDDLDGVDNEAKQKHDAALKAEVERLAALYEGGAETDFEAALAAMSEVRYAAIRPLLAARADIPMGALDAIRNKARPQQQKDANDDELGGRAITWPEVEPCSTAVDGAALVDEIVAVIGRHVVCDASGVDAAALWVLMTHVFESVRVGPRLYITAPDKACGKTIMLEIVGELVFRALQTVSVTPSVLFRVTEISRPTLLIDEADRIPRDAVELHALMNSGHTRASATVVRTVGDDYTPRQFSTWTPVALAGIGRLTDTLMSRSIVVRLQRKPKGGKVAKLREAHKRNLDPLRARIARWACDHADDVKRACADKAIEFDRLDGRNADNWEPLLAIAHVAGGEWPQRARRAALALTHRAQQSGNDGYGVMLLRSIHDIFEQRRAAHKEASNHPAALNPAALNPAALNPVPTRYDPDRITSSELCLALNNDDDAPWKTWNRGTGIIPYQVAGLLREFEIKPQDIRVGQMKLKGYKRADFEAAIDAYLTPPDTDESPPDVQPDTAPQTAAHTAPANDPDAFFREVNTDAARTRKRKTRDAL